MATTRAELGRLGEDLAVAHLRRRGYEILARNWRCTKGGVRGELDVVAADGDVLVVCEVKTRRGPHAGGPLEAVTADKLRRLRGLTLAYLAAMGGGWRAIRFDVVGVWFPGHGQPPELVHLRGVG